MDMLELRGVPDTFVTGLGAVEHIGGGNYRFTFFTCQDVQGRQEKVIAAKVIMSIETLPDAIHMAAKLTNLCACENVRNLSRN
jgi:hypothetical protein